MFAANRSIVLSSCEDFSNTNKHIQYFMGNIYITDTLDTINYDTLKNYKFGSIITISTDSDYIDINYDNPEIIKYNKEDVLHDYFKIYSINFPLYNESSRYYVSNKIYNLIYNSSISSMTNIIVVCPSFEIMLPILIEYFNLHIEYSSSVRKTYIEKFKNKYYISSMLRPFCTRDNIHHYDKYISKFKD